MAKKSNMSYGYDYDGTGNYSSTIRGGYTPFKLENTANTELFGQLIENLNDRQRKVAESRGSIKTALNQIKLNNKEEAYRNDLIRKYEDEIKKDPFNLPKAIELGAEAVNDKGLKARERYQVQYEDVVKRLKENPRYSQDTIDWYLNEANPYDYKDVKDANGEIVGNEYNAILPYEDVDWTQLYTELFKIVSPEKTDTTTKRSSGSDGNTNSSEDRQAVIKVGEDRIRLAAKDWVDSHLPQMRQAQQVLGYKYRKELDKFYSMDRTDPDYDNQKQLVDNLRWQYGVDPNTNLPSLEKYVNVRIHESKIPELMAYEWTETVDSTTNYKQSRGSGGGGTAGGGYPGVMPYPGYMPYPGAGSIRTESGPTVKEMVKGVIDTFSVGKIVPGKK